MKKTLLFITLIFLSSLVFGQWQLQSSIGVVRCESGSFSIGDTGFMMAGCNSTYIKDCWKYVPNSSGGTWTQIVNYPNASITQSTVACAMNDTGYMGGGCGGGYAFSNVFYKYHFNTWKQIASLPGSARAAAVAFSVLDTMYVGGGFNATGGSSYNSLNDFYKYDPTHNKWTKIASCPAAGVAWNAVAFSVGLKGYVGTGGKQVTPGGSPSFVPQSDFWQYDPTVNQWTRIADYPGGIRMGVVAWGTCDKGYAGTGVADAAQTQLKNDFYEYDPTLNKWTQIANYAGSIRDGSNSFVINKTAYICGGQNSVSNTKYKDLYSYNPSPLFKGNISVCTGVGNTFTDTTKQFTPTNWQWTFPGGTPATSTAQNPTITYSTAGNYDVTLSAWNGCDSGSTKYTSYVSVTTGPTIVVAPTNPTLCQGTSLILTASGGTTYSWTGSNTSSTVTASPLADTTYSLTVSNGTCSSVIPVTVTVTPIPTISVTGTSSICSGTSTTLNVTGGTTYSWSDGSTTSSITVSPVASGTKYVATGTSTGCSSKDSLTISVTTLPTINVSGTSSICSGTSTTLTATGGTTYSWSNAATSSSITVSPASTGTKYVATGTSSGCSSKDSLTITLTPTPIVNVSGISSICSGTSTTLSATGATTYSWSNASTTTSITVSPASTGTKYVATGTSSGCSSKDSLTITVNALPVMAVSPAAPEICIGSSIPLTASGAGATGAYTWKPILGITSPSAANTNGNPTQTTTYTVVGKDGNLCVDSTTVVLTVDQKPIPVISATQTYCVGSSTTLTVSGGTDYTWAPDSAINLTTIADPVVNPKGTTVYTVTVTSGLCSVNSTDTINVNALPAVSITGTSTILTGESTPLSVNYTAGNTYSWSSATTLSCSTCANPVATPTTTTWYTVTVTNSSFCTSTDSVQVTVKEVCGPIYVPNAFSPNSDGSNDVFKVMGNCIKGIELTVFDRWGNVVYQTTNPDAEWDGTSKGKNVNTGTYVYTLSVTDADNTVVNKQGNITLLR